MSVNERYPLIGAELDGGYTLTEGLGWGGFGQVYGAERGDEPFAVKICDPIIDISEEQARRLFEAEIRTQASLSHRNIVPLLEAGTYLDETAVVHGRPAPKSYDYFVMPRADDSLKARLPEDNLPASPYLAVEVVSDVAHGLDYAHGEGVLHRDIKPGNILSLPKPSAHWALSDFGIATKAHSLNTHPITHQWAVGSGMYVAPEQFEGNARKPSDIYALGMVAARICVGNTPYDIQQGPYTTPYRVALNRAKLLPFEQLVPKMDIILETMEPVIVRAIDKEPAKRYPSANDFADQLTDAYFAGKKKQEKATVVIDVGGTKPYTDPIAEVPKDLHFHIGIAEVPGGKLEPPAAPAPRKPIRLIPQVDPAPRPKGPDPVRRAPKATPKPVQRPAPERPAVPEAETHTRRGRLLRKVAATAVAATAAVGLLIGTEKGQNVIDFATDNRTALLDDILQTNPTDREAFAAALRALVDEEVEQNRPWYTYDDRPIRIMAGDETLADGYVQDYRSGKVNNNPKPSILSSGNPAIDGMYSSRLISAYTGKEHEPASGKETTLQLASDAQAYHWLGDHDQAKKVLDDINAESRYDMPPSHDALATPGKCSDFTVGVALAKNDPKFADEVVKEECIDGFGGPIHTAGRLAAISNDMGNVQTVLSTLFETQCEKSDIFTYEKDNELYLFTERDYCTTDQQFASAADIAAFTLFWLSKQPEAQQSELE